MFLRITEEKLTYFRKKNEMNIAIAGYGRMGREVESVALERGHTISVVLDVDTTGTDDTECLRRSDVAIEFTVPGSAPEVIGKILKLGIPVVSGTTGWLAGYDEIASLAIQNKTSFIHSSNFSPGVFVLSRLNETLARYMSKIGGYDVSIEEIHHRAKLDAPSGTAIMLAGQIVAASDDYSGWVHSGEEAAGKVPVTSVREGVVPGTHQVTWKSEIDILTISHQALSRRGFAVGAVMAAEFIAGKRGVFKLEEIFGF
jgi:4-hydroxy-tetrahydrodipicolinate reductase